MNISINPIKKIMPYVLAALTTGAVLSTTTSCERIDEPEIEFSPKEPLVNPYYPPIQIDTAALKATIDSVYAANAYKDSTNVNF